MSKERRQEGKETLAHDYPNVLICGYCKGGTTILAKTFAHCVDLSWQNEVRSLWGISKLTDRSKLDGELENELVRSGKWGRSKRNCQNRANS